MAKSQISEPGLNPADNGQVRNQIVAGVFAVGVALSAHAGGLTRIGHTTLSPRHTSPDDKGMYAAVIDPTNGFAYFIGNYLFKLDISGALPVQVGASLQTGQSTEAAIDPTGGYAYLPKANGNVFRYALGGATTGPSAAGSISLGGSGATSVVVDDSDPNPLNHFAYVLCSGAPATVFKVALSNFTAVSSLALNSGENNFAWGQIDKIHGYAYFASYVIYTAPVIPEILKIKLTPGTNAPIRIGTTNLGPNPAPLWTSSIDTLHGYAYYATDDGTTNVPETVFKVSLGAGDALPSAVPYGGVAFHTNEVQIISQIMDPVGGYVYLNDDNTYPGRVYQWALNGTNPPVEMGYLQLEGGTQPPLGNGVSGSNTTTNADGILPYGEVYLRSAVFDPVRGFGYLGQDSRPNQVVKIQVARDTPGITAWGATTGGGFQFAYTNTPGVPGRVLVSTHVTLSASNWTARGVATEISTGLFQFTDSQPGAASGVFYQVVSP